MRGFRRGVVMRPVMVAPMRRRRRFGPLGFIPLLIALGIIAYFLSKHLG